MINPITEYFKSNIQLLNNNEIYSPSLSLKLDLGRNNSLNALTNNNNSLLLFKHSSIQDNGKVNEFCDFES